MKAPMSTDDFDTVYKRRKATYDWMKNNVTPNHFCKVVVAPGLGLLPVPAAFRPYLAEVPGEITVHMNTSCIWTITVADINGKACLVKGWPAFAIAHDLHQGYLLLFKKLGRTEYKVIMFDLTGCQVARQCREHPLNFKKYKEKDE